MCCQAQYLALNVAGTELLGQQRTAVIFSVFEEIFCIPSLIKFEKISIVLFWTCYCAAIQLVSSALVPLSQLTFLANMTLANQWTLKLAASEAVHHVMTFDPNDSNYLYLMTSHHVSMLLWALASVSVRLFILLGSVTDLFMSAWRRTRLATIRPHFTSSESSSLQFSWTHTYLWPRAQTFKRFWWVLHVS